MVDSGDTRFVLGLDLGQAADYTALCITRKEVVLGGADDLIEEPEYYRFGMRLEKVVHLVPAEYHEWHCPYAERAPSRTPYEAIATGVVERIGRLAERGEKVTLCVDATGVGRGVVEIIRRAIKARGNDGPKILLVPIQVTSGSSPNVAASFVNVPKHELVTAAVTALQSGRLKIAPDVRAREALVRELQSYRRKVNISTGNASFEAWRENDHDDLVFALSMCCWLWESRRRRSRRAA
jgi:hypothetical protein